MLKKSYKKIYGKKYIYLNLADRAFWYIILFLGLAFIYIPIIVLIIFSFRTDSTLVFPIPGFGLNWYKTLFTNIKALDSFKNSIYIGGFTTLIATTLGTLGAYGLFKMKFKGRKLISSTMVLPLTIPGLVIGLSLLILFNIMNLRLSLFTIILGHSSFIVPYAFLIVLSRLQGIKPSFEEAARDLGATNIEVLRYITLPLIVPAVIAAALFSFTLSFDNFIITFLLTATESTLPLWIFGLVRWGVNYQANAIGTIIFTIAILSAIIGSLFIGRSRKTKL